MTYKQRFKTVAERFHEKYAVADNGCWIWLTFKDRPGTYPHMEIEGKQVRAHRLSYELHHGPIPKGQCVCHRCDNPKCVNPEHLFLGTRADNMKDMFAKGRGRAKPRELHPAAKLDQQRVDMIRALHETGKFKKAALAKQFGVSRALISLIVAGKRWT